jgi:hypothetical protein
MQVIKVTEMSRSLVTKVVIHAVVPAKVGSQTEYPKGHKRNTDG